MSNLATGPLPERRRPAHDAELRIYHLSAALDFCRGAFEDLRSGEPVSRNDAEAILRIIDRAQGRSRATERVTVAAVRRHVAEEVRRMITAAWQRKGTRVSVTRLLDRLIFVVRTEAW